MPKLQDLGRDISLTTGSRWVVGDIHGCIKTFKALLSSIQLEEHDQLFLLGDYINKGPSNLEVILEIIHLKGNIYPLLGNHDRLFLDYHNNPSIEKEENLRSLNSGELIDADRDLRKKIISFLNALPYYYYSGDTILVHAGFNFELDDVLTDTEAMLTIKEFNYDAKKVGGKSIVHGHFPTELNHIISAVARAEQVVPLDNGCVYQGNKEGIGNLVAMELNQRLLIFQPNLD